MKGSMLTDNRKDALQLHGVINRTGEAAAITIMIVMIIMINYSI